jgi:endonuclease YncB( thermonuclease family)
VVDGDTLWMKIHLGPRQWVKEKLRLRGLDCPEMDTPEGKAAKRFVETLVAGAKSVTITTFKPDKWDRYLADVFLAMDGEGGRAQQDCAPTGEIFLNNALLANGHAVRMDEYALTDWAGG